MVLGVNEYLPKCKQGSEAVILNVASIAAVIFIPQLPIYTGTKCGVIGLTKAWAQDIIYQQTKIKVVAVCPGRTTTPIQNKVDALTLPSPLYDMQFVENFLPQG